MSQRGPWVKVIDAYGNQGFAGIQPSYKRNETSPAQYMESRESGQTQPLVVLPEGLTAQKKVTIKAFVRPGRSFYGAKASDHAPAARPYGRACHSLYSFPNHNVGNVAPLHTSSGRDVL